MIIRTWACLNRNCRNEWTADGDHPKCPKCGALKVKWVPGGFAIMKKSPGYDKTIRSLTDHAGMTNMSDPVAGERSAPKVTVPKAARFEDIKVAGVSGKVGIASDGSPVPTCLPNGMSDKVTVSTGTNFRDGGVSVPVRVGDRMMKAPLSGPTPLVVARHKGRAS